MQHLGPPIFLLARLLSLKSALCVLKKKQKFKKIKIKIQFWRSSVFLLNFLLNFSQFAAFSLAFTSAKIY